MDIDLLKQQQVRARPCPASTLRSPPLELLPEAPRMTCVSVVPKVPRESTLAVHRCYGGLSDADMPSCTIDYNDWQVCSHPVTAQPRLPARPLSCPHVCSQALDALQTP